MNSQLAYTKDGQPLNAWYCSKCKTVYHSMLSAEMCCTEPDSENGYVTVEGISISPQATEKSLE